MLLDRLAATMSGVSGGRVILADENLDHEEFQLQARFFVDPKADPRFRFRLHLHQPGVFHSYDVVLFDSPPRVTTSVVNALACSDYVLVPTKLDDGSIGAVPRALAWMKSLGSVCPAELLGVIASHARVLSGALVKGDNDSYEYLRRVVESNCGDAKKVLKDGVWKMTKDTQHDENTFQINRPVDRGRHRRGVRRADHREQVWPHPREMWPASAPDRQRPPSTARPVPHGGRSAETGRGQRRLRLRTGW